MGSYQENVSATSLYRALHSHAFSVLHTNLDKLEAQEA